MRFSPAYCHNGAMDEEFKPRDSFLDCIRSAAAHYDDHWMKIDWFATCKHVQELPSVVKK
jgi:hypothetical protein